MRSLRRSLAMNVFQRWRTSIPFVLALGTLLYIFWAVWLGITSPFDGIASIDRNGLIGELDPRYPNAQVLQVNDIVLEVDGIPYKESFPTYGDKRAGSAVLLSVQRGERIIPIAIQLANPPFQEILTRLLPVLAALIFLGVAAGVQAFLPAYEATNLFFLLFAASAVMLTTGPVTFFGPWWLSGIFWFLILIIGPLAVHFHFYFPQTTDFRFKRPLLYSLYATAIIGSVLYFLAAPLNILTSPWFGDFLAAIEIFLAINLLIVVSLLVYVYRHANSPGVRSKIRIVVLGGALSLMAFVQLSILPDALLQQPIIPYTFAFLLLCIIPLTYGYAIFRHRLIEIEKHINRGATIILVYTLLGATYLILYSLISRWLPPTLAGEALILNTVLVLFLASIFIPVQRRVQRLVDTVFYGGWYDYRSAVTQISQGLEQVTNLRSLAIVLADRLVTTLRLEDACVFLRDLEGDFSVIEVAPRDVLRDPGMSRFTNLPRSSLTFLLKMGDEVGRSSLRDAMAEVTFTAEERELLNTEQDHLWVPVIGHAQVQGMLALGPKYGGDIFSNEDIDILRIIARQIGPLVENIHLLTQLRQHAAELEVRVEERTVELYTAKTRVEAILASVGDGVIVTDLDGTILTVNGAYLEQSGEQTTEVIGRQLYDLFAKQNDANILADMRSILQQGRIWIGELISQHKDGGQYDVQLTVAPIRDQNGNMVGFVGSQRDITRQKELARLKDVFVSDVSHELRTPTSNISLYLELLQEAPPEKYRHYMQVLIEQSQLLRKLVEDILDLSRLTMGKARRIEFSPVDLNELTQQVITAHQAAADISALDLRFEPCPNLSPVFGEPNQLGRLITNLVANALRYTMQGEVIVRTFQIDHSICLEVKDTGIGIDPEDRPHLFERFYRGRRVRQSYIPGTGLGLAIVKEIVDLHGAEIDVECEDRKGSKFTVRFPCE